MQFTQASYRASSRSSSRTSLPAVSLPICCGRSIRSALGTAGDARPGAGRAAGGVDRLARGRTPGGRPRVDPIDPVPLTGLAKAQEAETFDTALAAMTPAEQARVLATAEGLDRLAQLAAVGLPGAAEARPRGQLPRPQAAPR